MDLVFVAQRGTQYSWPQTCPGLTGHRAGAGAAVRRCLASVNRDPRHDTTAAAARDLDQVRKALGYNKINIYGGSYGVSMGLAYLQRYGAHVRTAVFYSGSLLNVPLWQLTPVHAQQAFDQLARRCAAAPACARALPPGRRPGHRGQPAARPPGPGHHHRPQRPAADGHHHPARLPQRPHRRLPLLADTAVLLPADLHAFARGQWAKVITKRGLASATAAAAARPPSCRRSPSAAATPGPR